MQVRDLIDQTGTKAMATETLHLTHKLESHRAPSSKKPVTSAKDFASAKVERQKLSMVTCYDYTFARILSQSRVDAILVGDSAAMVMHGHSSTLPATIDLIRLHT